MATTKKRVGNTSDQVFTKSESKLTRMPVLNAARQAVAKEAEKLFDKKTLQGRLQDVATRKTSIEEVLLKYAKQASKSLDSIVREENRVAEQEALMNKKYLDSLAARKKETKGRRLRRGRKNEFLITGQVLHPESNEPVPGIVVEAIDKDIVKHDFLDVDTTDAEGRYEISFLKKDFNERGEGLPEVVLRTSIDRKSIMHTTKDIIKAEPNKREIVDITLPKDQLKFTQKVILSRKSVDRKRLTKVNQLRALEPIQHAVLQEIGSSFKDSLNKAIILLESRAAKKGK